MPKPQGARAPQWPITTAWKAMIRARMQDLRLRPVDLARALNTSTAQISLLFSTAKSSGMIPRIHKALRLPPPEMPGLESELDALKSEIDEGWAHLTEEERDIVARIVRLAVRRRGPT